MEIQIIILLLFALRTISAQLMNIPPAPTLPDLDISSFPDYMQRLLANTPQINNVQSDPLYVPQTSRKPHTYGMKLRGDKGEIWNDISGSHLYINDIAPSKSIRPTFLHNKEDEPNNSLKTNDKSIAPKNYNDYNQKFPSITIGKPEIIMNATPQILPENHFKTTQSDLPSVPPTLIPETPAKISASAEVQKDENGNQNDENILTPQTLPEEIPAIVHQQDNSAANPTANETSAEIPEKSIEYTNGEDKIVQSFNDIIATMDSNKENRKYESSKTYGMKLKGDHGYVWNDLAKLGIHYNVGELETTYTSKPTVEEELKNTHKVIVGSEEDKSSCKVTPATTEGSIDLKSANVNEERSTQETRPETSHINPTAKGRETNWKDKPCKNITPELNDSLKKYIAKLVKEEVAKQLLGKNNTQIDTESSNGSNNKAPVADHENKKIENHYGSIIGNGKVKNVFVFHLNDKNIKSTVNDTTVLNKPVNEILNDIINKDENINKPDDASNALTNQPIESPETTVTAESNQPDTNPINNKEIEKYKDTETITPNTAEGDVTTVHSTAVDEGNQTTQTTIGVQDDATEANPNESASAPAIDSSQDDITNSTVTESINPMKPSNDSSLTEVNNIGESPEATAVSNEGAELGTNTKESNSTIDSINTSTDSLTEIVDNGNETQATQTASNEDAELTTITTIAEVGNVTSERAVTAEPSEDITTEVTVTETGSPTDVKDGIDEVSASSDVSLPTSNS